MRPPGVARGLLLLVPADVRRRVRDHLDEEFDVVRWAEGLRAARRWYWKYALRSVWDSRIGRIGIAAAEAKHRGGKVNWEWGGDLKHGFRLLVREPVVSSVMIGTVVLGIGAVSAVASLVYGVLVRPLPFPGSGQLVQISRTGGGEPPEFRAVGLLDLRDWRERSRTMDEVAGWSTAGETWTGEGEARRVVLAEVTEGFDRVLGVAAARGRFFVPEEFGNEASRVLVLSDAFWRGRLGADPDIVGRTLLLDGTAHLVVGVLPALDLEYPPVGFDAWRPLTRDPDHWSLQVRGASWLSAIGRIRSDVSHDAAQSELSTIQQTLVDEYPRSQPGQSSVRLEPLKDVLVGPARRALTLLGTSVLIILLVASINLGVLLLARAIRRAPELSIRAALGGSAGRIRRQLLAEAMVVCGVGGSVGVLSAPWTLDAIVSWYPGGLPRGNEVGLEWPIVLGCAAMIVTTALVAGMMPALWAARYGASGATSRPEASRVGGRLREWLAGTQVAISALLLIGAALFVQTLRNLSAADLGFDGDGVVAFRVSPAAVRYPDPATLALFYSELLGQVRSLPDVAAAGLTNFAPFTSGEWGHGFRVVGEAASESRVQDHPANVRITGGRYYTTLGIPLIRGRWLDERDDESSAPVAMLNQSAVRQAFGRVDPLGRLIEFEGTVREVVGVVGDVRHHTLAEEPAPEIHIPVWQAPPSSAWVVAKHGRSAVHAADLRAAVGRVDPTIAVVGMASYEERLASAVQAERFRAALATALGLLAVTIALLGVYGTLSNVVFRRRREIGIRLALGEGRIKVVRRVLARAATLAALGALVGSVLAAALSSRLSGLLFEVETRDAPTYAAVALLVWGVGVLAGLGPAWTASRLDPVEAIRRE